MNITMENHISLENLNVSSINYLKCILQQKNSHKAQNIRTPNGIEFLAIIDKNFNELQNPEVFVQLLEVFHLIIQKSPVAISKEMSKSIGQLLTKHSANEPEYLIALQLFKQFLSSLPNDFPIEDELIQQIMKPFDSLRVQNHLAMCICILVEKFKMTSLLDIVWNEIQRTKSSSLMLNYIDLLVVQSQIYRRSEFWQLVEIFLLADSNRKMAIFTIRKVLKYLTTNKEDVIVEKYFIWPGKNLITSWLAYLTILENLEEKQSHLILPALQMLQNVDLGEGTPWKRILLQQMLRHKNNLVLRWSVNYLFSNFSKLILEYDILEDFLQATNHTWLFNERESISMSSFELREEDRFMRLFSEVAWKSVPMHVWLMTISQQQHVNSSDVDSKTIANIAARIRQLQNRLIRSACRGIFASLFESKIEELSLKDFICFLDAFYSNSDQLSPSLLSLLMSKIEKTVEPFLSYNLFTILAQSKISLDHQAMIVKKLKTMEPRNHQWFSVLLVFFFENSVVLTHEEIQTCSKDQLLKEFYGLEVSSPLGFEQLPWNDVSKAVIRELAVDWCTMHQQPESLDDSNFEDLLHKGGINTLLNLTDPKTRQFPLSRRMLNGLVGELRNLCKRNVDTSQLIKNILESCKNDQPSHLHEFINEILDIDVSNIQLAFNVFENCLYMCDFNEDGGRKLLIRGLLFGEPLTGDARLEYDYAVRLGIPKLDSVSTYRIRKICLKHLHKLDQSQVHLLQSNLIQQSKTMSIRKPRYFENSRHHRLKLRIAQALTVLNPKSGFSWHDYYLHSILHENNQTNVTYIFEFIVAITISREELIRQMEQLSRLSTSCQCSMIAISFLFCVHHNCGRELIDQLIALILPWTMGSNFNTRTHAQMAVYHLVRRFKMEKFDYLRSAIERGLQESTNAIEKLNTDVRFNFPAELSFEGVAEPIIYLTAMPEDECLSSNLERYGDFGCLREARQQILLKKEPSKEQEMNGIVEDVQRKMNPEIDSCDNLSNKQEGGKHFDMIVVASLIDKLPNLGGIARTCEVLGIRQLVLDSVKHTQNKEFKNLSMTAENWINITEVKTKGLKEFLVCKQIEGYKIVGAEQTSNSVNFMEFEFPEKSVLLLGHEKEGIPADLIALLDFAVEIPQFGMVRSLNVHVTGALFMYEYCKQRLKNKTK